MKYWNSRHWKNWGRLIQSLNGALTTQGVVEDRLIAAPEADLPEASAVFDYSDITGTHATPDNDEQADVQSAEGSVDAKSDNVIGALFPDANWIDINEPTPTEEPSAEAPDELAKEEAPETLGNIRIQPEAHRTSEAPKSTLRSATFFSRIPWDDTDAATWVDRASLPTRIAAAPKAGLEARIRPSGPNKPAKPAKPLEPNTTAHFFFNSIPWDRGGFAVEDEKEEEEVMRVSVNSGSFDAGLDIRHSDVPGDNMLVAGMLSAARTADRRQSVSVAASDPISVKRVSREFFGSIPW